MQDPSDNQSPEQGNCTLIVEESETHRAILKAMLKQAGVSTIEAASSGTDALEKLESKSYNLVICTIELSGISGLDLLRKAQQSGLLRTLPFVMVATSSESKVIDQALLLGASSYITKPYSPNHISRVVKEVLNTSPLAPEILTEAAGEEICIPKEENCSEIQFNINLEDSPQITVPDYKKLRVLIVDEDDEFRKSLKETLEKLGIRTVVENKSATIAKHTLESGLIDLVFCDSKLSQASGLELLKNTRSHRSTWRLPFIMLNKAAEKNSVVEALRAGVSDYLLKPVELSILIESLNRVLSEAAQSSESKEELEALFLSQQNVVQTTNELVESAMTLEKPHKDTLRELRILLVDDDEKCRRIIKSRFMRMGFKEILETSVLTSALRKLEKGNIDLVFSDWEFTEASGLDLLGQMQGDKSLQKIPFVMFTSFSEKEQVLEALRQGVSDYLLKPCTIEELAESVARVLPQLASIEAEENKELVPEETEEPQLSA